MKKLRLVLIALPLLVGCAGTSSNVQTAPLQYSQNRGNQGEDIPAIRGQVTVLTRNQPAEGAVKAVADTLPNIASSLNPTGALTIFGTSPERTFSELERGKRKQATVSFEVDNAKGETYTVHAYLKGIQQDSETGKVTVDDADLNIESKQVKSDSGE